MRILLALAALLLLATFAPVGLYRPPPLPKVAMLRAEPVQLFEDEPAKRDLGRLVFLHGWKLTSNDRRLGGISAMHVDGGGVAALSDSGDLIRFVLPAKGRESRQQLSIMPLGWAPGRSLMKRERDTEAMVVSGDLAWVGYERRDEIWRYRLPDWTEEEGTSPPEMKRWSDNAGSEAMLRLPDGRFLVFSEGRSKANGPSDVLLFDGDPAVADTPVIRLGYSAPEGYRITDAALLPDGHVLFLNRRFALLEGFSARLTIGMLPELEEGALLTGEELARFDGSALTDNYEALSVTRESGRTTVWIASDDNFTPMQQTLLLKFRLAE